MVLPLLAAQPTSALVDVVSKEDTTKLTGAQRWERFVKDCKSAASYFHPYGFVRNYMIMDTRESYTGGADQFYFGPKDQRLNEYGDDLNQLYSLKFVNISTRLGLDIKGLDIGMTQLGAKIEVDFQYGLSGTTGTAQLRLRHAYISLGWKDLPMSRRDTTGKASVELLLGQTWHPMVNLPTMLANEAGTPFSPFSRAPQMQMKANLGSHVSLTAALLWQMQYTSVGPNGASADYLNYACTPEAYLGVTAATDAFKATLGADVLSIKPRKTSLNGAGVEVRVSDRLTTVNPMLYLEYKTLPSAQLPWYIQAKTVFGSGGEHLQMMSGYALRESFDDGHSTYAPLHHTTSYINVGMGSKMKINLFAGYYQNLGTSVDINPYDASGNSNIYFHKSGSSNLRRMIRVQPTIMYHFKPWGVNALTVGLEYAYTTAQYGDAATINNRGLATNNLHWVGNHRLQAVIKYDFDIYHFRK